MLSFLSAAVLSAGVNNGPAAYAGKTTPPSETSGRDAGLPGDGGPLGAGDNQWTNAVPPAPIPEARWGHATAYNLESDRVILFGGQVLSGPMSDETWAFNPPANRWANMNPVPRPSLREGAGMGYDIESDRVVLFGGGNHYTGVYTDNTWAYDYNSNTWTNETPAVHPSARADMSIAYDRESDRMILFGGTAAAVNNETWAYDLNANRWTNMNPTTSPSPRQAFGMAYDAVSDRVILFGGAPGPTSDTWAYDFNRNKWTNMNPASSPPARWGTRMAYDAHADRTILFGGWGWSGGYHNDTWAYNFNANAWVDLSPIGTPGGLEAPSLTFASCSNRAVLFGGYRGPSAPVILSDETWRYQYAAVAPVLQAQPGSFDFGIVVRGWSGSSVVQVRNAGTGTLCFEAASSAPWIGVTPSAGNSVGEWDGITVSVDTTGLAAGVHSALVAVTSNAGSTNVSVTVTVNRPPVLGATGQANYVADGLDPESGYLATTFSYRVSYADPDNDSPAAGDPKVDIRKAGVAIPGSPFTMTEMDPSDATYVDGKWYAFSTTLATYGADYDYQFRAADFVGNLAGNWPASPVGAPAVVNRAPVLAWVGVAPYASDGLDVEAGVLDSTFVFRVVYSDADNQAPQPGVLLQVRKGFAPVPGSPFLMAAADPSDTTYADGKVYILSLLLPVRGDDYAYSFTASDGVDVAVGAPIAYTDAPDVGNRRPELTFPTGAFDNGVEPDRGPRGSGFTFEVLYRDEDNDAPSVVELVLEKAGVAYGLPLAMNGGAWVASPGDYVAGRVYSVVVILPDEGADYTILFRASDVYDPTNMVDSTRRDAPDVVAASPAPESNWKPVVAGAFAAVLIIVALAAGRPARRNSGGLRAARKTLALTSLPFVAGELTTGVASYITGSLSIPPIIGLGTFVDVAILVTGLIVISFRSRPKPDEKA